MPRLAPRTSVVAEFPITAALERSYTFDFGTVAPGQLRVEYRGPGELDYRTPWGLDREYTVDGLGRTVTLAPGTAVADGGRVRISRDTLIERLTEFRTDAYARGPATQIALDRTFDILEELAARAGYTGDPSEAITSVTLVAGGIRFRQAGGQAPIDIDLTNLPVNTFTTAETAELQRIARSGFITASGNLALNPGAVLAAFSANSNVAVMTEGDKRNLAAILTDRSNGYATNEADIRELAFDDTAATSHYYTTGDKDAVTLIRQRPGGAAGLATRAQIREDIQRQVGALSSAFQEVFFSLFTRTGAATGRYTRSDDAAFLVSTITLEPGKFHVLEFTGYDPIAIVDDDIIKGQDLANTPAVAGPTQATPGNPIASPAFETLLTLDGIVTNDALALRLSPGARGGTMGAYTFPLYMSISARSSDPTLYPYSTAELVAKAGGGTGTDISDRAVRISDTVGSEQPSYNATDRAIDFQSVDASATHSVDIPGITVRTLDNQPIGFAPDDEVVEVRVGGPGVSTAGHATGRVDLDFDDPRIAELEEFEQGLRINADIRSLSDERFSTLNQWRTLVALPTAATERELVFHYQATQTPNSATDAPAHTIDLEDFRAATPATAGGVPANEAAVTMTLPGTTDHVYFARIGTNLVIASNEASAWVRVEDSRLAVAEALITRDTDTAELRVVGGALGVDVIGGVPGGGGGTGIPVESRGALLASTNTLQTASWGTGTNNAVRFTLGAGATEYTGVRIYLGGQPSGIGFDFQAWDDATTRVLLPDEVLGTLWVAKVGNVEKDRVKIPLSIGEQGRSLPADYYTVAFSRSQEIFVHQRWIGGANAGHYAVELLGNNTTLPANSTIEVYWWLDGGGGLDQEAVDARVVASDNAATEAKRGNVELADQDEARAGADMTKAISPAKLSDILNYADYSGSRLVPKFSVGDVGEFLGVRTGGTSFGWVPLPVASATQAGILSTTDYARIGMGGGTFDVATEEEAEAGTDNTKGMTPLRTKQAIDHNRVPSGNTLPAKPWRTGQRFRLLMDQTLPHDPLIHYSEADSSATSNEFLLPADARAVGPVAIRSYSAAYQTAALQDGVFVDSTVAPASGAQVVWYPDTRPYNAATDLYSIATSGPTGYTRWYKLGRNASGQAAGFAQTNTEVPNGGFHFNFVNWTSGGGRVYPDEVVTRGDLTFEGGDAGQAGWIPTPGVGLDRAQVTELVRELTVTEAITPIMDGPGTGFPVGGSTVQNHRAVYNFENDAGEAFDLTDDDNMSGLIELEATLTLATQSNASLGLGSVGTSSITFSNFFFARTLRDLPAFDAMTPNWTAQSRLVRTATVYWHNPTTGAEEDLGRIQLRIGRGSDGALRYIWRWRTGTAGTWNLTFGVTLRAAFIHQEPPASADTIRAGLRGSLRATSSVLNTATVADGTGFAPPTGWTIAPSSPGYNRGGPSPHNLLLVPTVAPSGVNGLWIVSKVGTVERHAVFIPWGPGVLTTEGTDHDAEVVLFFQAEPPALGGISTPQRIIVRWRVNQAGYSEILLVGDGTALPANSTIEVYEAGVTLTGLKGEKGDKGDPGAGTALDFENDGTALAGTGAVDTINFNTGLRATRSGTEVTVDATATGGGLSVEEDGTRLGTAGTVDTINAAGGIRATRSGNEVALEGFSPDVLSVRRAGRSITAAQAAAHAGFELHWENAWQNNDQVTIPMAGVWTIVNWAYGRQIEIRGSAAGRRTVWLQGNGDKVLINVTGSGDCDLVTPLQRTGSVNVTAGSGTQAVTFSPRFAGTGVPIVTGSASTAAGAAAAAVTGISATGFSIARAATAYTYRYIAMRTS